MPITLSALVANTASVTLDYGEAGSLTIVYRPALINERTLSALAIEGVTGAEQLAEVMGRLNAELCRLIERWDLTDDAGVAIPLTPDALSGLPLMMRMSLITTIASDVRMGELNGSASNPPSSNGRHSAAKATGSSRSAARSRTGSRA